MRAQRKVGSSIPRILVASWLITLAAGTASAQDSYPSRSIKVIVPFGAGGLVDVLARLVGDKLQAKWSQPVVVENRPGASGNLGAELVAKAEADGYTLLVAPPPPLAINQSLFPKLAFDPAAFAAVTVIATVPNILVVNPKVGASNVRELLAFAKANPDKLSYASTGSGGTPHLTAEMLKREGRVHVVHVPYKGMPPALTDLLGGQVDIMFANLGDALPHVRDGRLKPLAVTSRERFPGLPGLPTMGETLPGFVSETWYAVVAPPRTSPQITARLSTAIAEALRQPDVRQRLESFSATPVLNTPTDAAAFITQERQRWGEIIHAAQIKPE